jgi:hypothetical protein
LCAELYPLFPVIEVDQAIVVTINRKRQTLLWSDGWAMTSEAPEMCRYEKRFEENVPLVKIAESVQRMLDTPGWQATSAPSFDSGSQFQV